MEQNAKYYYIQELVSHSCLSHIINAVSHSILYPNLHQEHRIQVGNGQFISILFIIPIIIDIHRNRFEIYTLELEIHENIDLVLGIENIFELEGVINSQDCSFNFLDRSIPIFPKQCIVPRTREQKLTKVEAPFIDEISGLAIIKILDKTTQSTMMLKLKFMHNSAMLDITNNGLDTIIFGPEEVLGIIDLRSLGYYKIKQGILQQNLSKYYRFKKIDTLCEQFNKFINTLKKDRKYEESKDKYPWLDHCNDV